MKFLIFVIARAGWKLEEGAMEEARTDTGEEGHDIMQKAD